MELKRLINELAANSWPAYIQQTVGNWRLRANFGVSKRANSVWTVGDYPDGDWMELVEEFYQRHGVTPAYYLSESSPADLDEILEAKGYQKIFECYTMIAECKDVLVNGKGDPRFTFELSSIAGDRWMTDFLRLEGYPEKHALSYSHIFSCIGPRKSFVQIFEKGEVVGVGTVVSERGWAGLSNIVIAPGQRGKGAATALIRELTSWATDHGATGLYLQVIKENAPAVALYRKLGFSPLYEHHYRVAPNE